MKDPLPGIGLYWVLSNATLLAELVERFGDGPRRERHGLKLP
jgi:hypothetical protein